MSEEMYSVSIESSFSVKSNSFYRIFTLDNSQSHKKPYRENSESNISKNTVFGRETLNEEWDVFLWFSSQVLLPKRSGLLCHTVSQNWQKFFWSQGCNISLSRCSGSQVCNFWSSARLVRLPNAVAPTLSLASSQTLPASLILSEQTPCI